MAKSKRPDPEKVRATVAAFTHEQAHLLQVAALTQADVLDQLDALFPSVEQRDAANALRALAEQFATANGGRQFIEEKGLDSL